MSNVIKDFNLSTFGFITLNRVNNALILLERYDRYPHSADAIYRSQILKDFECLLDIRTMCLKSRFKMLKTRGLL